MLKLRVNDILKERKITKYWLAERVNMSYGNFTKMTNNKTNSIRFDVLEKLSDNLNCTIDELFDRTNK